ncbi:DUF1559 domain-containing protein [Fimbriiglobus ruber]|uniref:DUF1559 domain-containing protein n=1 Tax=Fimbriiglobus ruber TaxID=1908690 RepID=A0A225DMD9_9BACT|nr:DUF1559 domain-containing protein [Fimbriiglobus ruber]OWK39718.1 hypothetical protein FRUB_05608 [Fimbriiglobus ruber]
MIAAGPYTVQGVMLGGVGDGGPGSLDASVVSVFVCPSDGLPSPAVGQIPGTNSYLGLSSYRGSMSGKDPSDPQYGTDGVIVNGVTGSVRITDITDGTSNTLMFGEHNNVDPNWPAWAAVFAPVIASDPSVPYWVLGSTWTTQILFDQAGTAGSLNALLPSSAGDFSTTSFYVLSARASSFGSRHTGGANFTLADGSVRFISNAVNSNPTVLPALATRAGGEVIDPSAY